jgi:hypothetical protein
MLRPQQRTANTLLAANRCKLTSRVLTAAAAAASSDVLVAQFVMCVNDDLVLIAVLLSASLSITMPQSAPEAASAAAADARSPSAIGSKRSYAESLAECSLWRDLLRECGLPVDTMDFGPDVCHVVKYDAAIDPNSSVILTQRSGKVRSGNGARARFE